MKLKSIFLLITLGFLFACTPAENTESSATVNELPTTETPTEPETPKETTTTNTALSFEDTRWKSTDDSKSVIEVKDGKWNNIYDGETLDSGDYKVEKKEDSEYLTVNADGEVYEYYIIKHTEKELEMSMVGGRGNTLNYKKVH